MTGAAGDLNVGTPGVKIGFRSMIPETRDPGCAGMAGFTLRVKAGLFMEWLTGTVIIHKMTGCAGVYIQFMVKYGWIPAFRRVAGFT
jgi:hypothetical protein